MFFLDEMYEIVSVFSPSVHCIEIDLIVVAFSSVNMNSWGKSPVEHQNVDEVLRKYKLFQSVFME